MYETPKLNCVGRVEEVVLGYATYGPDIDTTAISPDMEFFEDPEPSLPWQ